MLSIPTKISIKIILDLLGSYQENVQKIKISDAYEYALNGFNEQHEKEKQQSFILKTAYILCKLRVDQETIIASFLHNLSPDKYGNLTKIKEIFGTEIESIVERVRNLTKIYFRINSSLGKSESIQKLYLEISKDLRVLLIKFSSRLVNLLNIDVFKPHKQKRLIEETTKVYCPILKLFGIWQMLGHMEDLCFKYEKPKAYQMILDKYGHETQKRKTFINKIVNQLQSGFKINNIQATVEGRMKHLYSIYQKINLKQKHFNEIYDVFAFRVLTSSINECYTVLGLIHSIWQPKSGRFKDYIATPKTNGYQSLHTTVFCSDNKLSEFQIRTKKMNDEAEFGVAAHFYYKGNLNIKNSSDNEWIKTLLNIQKEYKKTSIKKINLDLFKDRIFVFTPKNDIVDLPLESSCIDYAYNIHQKLGNSAESAVINQKPCSLIRTLKTGDIIEIIRNDKAHPHANWLLHIKTNYARQSILKCLKKYEKEKRIVLGLEILNNDFKRYCNCNFQDINQNIRNKVYQKFNKKNFEELILAIAEGNLISYQILKTCFTDHDLLQIKPEHSSNKTVILHISFISPKPIFNKIAHKIAQYNLSVLEMTSNNKFKHKTLDFTIKVKKFKDLYDACNALDLFNEINEIKVIRN